MSDIAISTVVVTWNSAAFIGSCLDALIQSTRRPLECLVVDNASTDGTAEIVRQHYRWVTLLTPGRNLGFTAANNLALGWARGANVLLLNPDCALRPGALDAMVDLFERRPQAGAVGPQLRNSDGSLQFSTYRMPTPATVAWEYFLRDVIRANDPRAGRYARADYACERQVEGLLGACMLVRRAAAEQVGWLDERFVMYCEEVDWCIRLRRADWQLWYTPTAQAVHHGGQSTRLAVASSFLELQRSRFKLYSKWYPRSERVLLEGISRAAMLYQMAFWSKQRQRGRLTDAEWRDRLMLCLRVLALRPSGLPWQA